MGYPNFLYIYVGRKFHIEKLPDSPLRRDEKKIERDPSCRGTNNNTSPPVQKKEKPVQVLCTHQTPYQDGPHSPNSVGVGFECFGL